MFNLPDLKPEEVIIYLRKSRTDDPSLTVSETLSKHEQMLDDFCRRTWDALVPEQNRFREVVSGETIESRPEIKKVLRLIEQDRYKAILIVEPQRLSRGDLEDIGRLSKLLRYTHTYVLTLQYSYDLSDERDRDYFERELKRGNEYLEYSKRIMANGKALAAENGNYIGSQAPFGYKRVKYKEGKRHISTLEIIPDEAEIIREIYRMYADGMGSVRICKHLNQYCKPQRGKLWARSSIYHILKNPLYLGKIKWQHRKTINVVEEGEIVKHSHERKDYPIYEGRHEAIVSQELWDAVRARQDAHDIPKVNASTKLRNPLAGIVSCECGSTMMMWTDPKGRASARLVCAKKMSCNSASCTYDEMQDIVAEILRQSIADFEVKIESGADDRITEKEEFKDQLRRRLAALDDKETSIWEKYAEGMPKRVFDSLIADLTEERSRLEATLEEAEKEKPIRYSDLMTTFHAALECLDSDLTAGKKNALLKKCIKKIVYHRPQGKSKHDMKPINVDVELNI